LPTVALFLGPVAYRDDCLLSIGCCTDRCHDWQTWQTISRF